ncbi:MAG: sodium:calcium antiporter [Gemmatimonadetes bacterium]|nr:sodium:calcium antiporter [Gemmatimonadota bacterium]NNL30119.1 sodium:calcium antiporter [Gemmatimonadota bacterium]
MIFALLLGGTLVGTALLWFACSRLEESTHRLAEHYGIPDAVKGSILLAVASSMPELVTALLAFPVHGDFELGLSAIIGSAIFNILVIPAFSVYARGRPLEANRDLVYREGQFYLVSVTVLMLILSLSVIYGGDGSLNPVAEAGERQIFRGEFDRTLALFPLMLYGLYVYIQFEEVKRQRDDHPRKPGISPLREWSILAGTIVFILVGVEMLLQVAMTLGDLLQTPTFLWGMTIVAAATSLPDTFVSVRASVLGRTESSVSNVLGSNVFDLLVAVPAGVMLTGAIVINFTQIVPMMVFLVVATIVMLVFMLRDMRLSRREAHVMMALYVMFGIWMTMEAFGVMNLLGVRAVL